jgi:iron complex outermembrane receptor protein
LNVGLYYYNYKGFRTSYNRDTPSPADYAAGPQSSPVNLTVPAKNIGGELELLYRLTESDRIGLNGNYVQSRWYDQPAEYKQAQPEEKRSATPYTLTANYEHVFNLPGGSTLSARIDGRYEAANNISNVHVDLVRIGYDQYAHVSARTTGNLSAGWASEGGRYSISAYVRNFTDKQYKTYTIGGDLHALTVAFTDPRTYGVTLAARF